MKQNFNIDFSEIDLQRFHINLDEKDPQKKKPVSTISLRWQLFGPMFIDHKIRTRNLIRGKKRNQISNRFCTTSKLAVK